MLLAIKSINHCCWTVTVQWRRRQHQQQQHRHYIFVFCYLFMLNYEYVKQLTPMLLCIHDERMVHAACICAKQFLWRSFVFLFSLAHLLSNSTMKRTSESRFRCDQFWIGGISGEQKRNGSCGHLETIIFDPHNVLAQEQSVLPAVKNRF